VSSGCVTGITRPTSAGRDAVLSDVTGAHPVLTLAAQLSRHIRKLTQVPVGAYKSALPYYI
jgi:hypothetical protein